MSWTYRKTISFTDNQRGGAKKAKRLANRQVRQTADVPSGMQYKNLYSSWDIHDYRFNYYDDEEIITILRERENASGWMLKMRMKKSLLNKKLFTRESIRFMS